MLTPTLPNGSTLGRFVILGLVGRGAMGEVYAAYDPNLDRKIAIKLVGTARDRDSGAYGQDGRARLMREAQATARISHPNVVVVYEAGALDDWVFIAMEFVEGHTLRYWLQAAPRSWPEIVGVFTAAGRGLAAAHERDLVHRDFKPDNVMVSGNGAVRVMDFGLARWGASASFGAHARTSLVPVAGGSPVAGVPAEAFAGAMATVDPDATQKIDSSEGVSTTTSSEREEKLTVTGAVMGTPAYMSPEQFSGRSTDARSDQFSFCVALFEALHGARPFRGQSFPELAEAVTGGSLVEPPESRSIPAWLADAVRRGLAIDPADRFASMSDLLAAIERRPSAVRTDFASGAASRLAGVWSPRPLTELDAVSEPSAHEKAEVRAAFLATGKVYAEATFDRIRTLLDRYVERWSALYVEACEATHLRGEQSTEVLDLRIESLMAGLRELTALCQLFRTATAEVVANAVSAAMALPSPERCRNIDVLRTVVRPPADAATQASVTALRVRIGGLRALLHVGRYREGLEQCTSAVAEARRLGYGPVLAEVLLLQGCLSNDVGRPETAVACLDEAVWSAELARHDEIAAEVATSLVYTYGYLQSRFELGETWSRHTEMLLRRMGGHDDLWGWYLNNRAAMRKAEGDLDRAIADARAAITIKARAFGPESPDVGVSYLNLAACLVEHGATAEGIAASEQAIEILTVGWGPQHPKTAFALSNHGEWLYRTGTFAGAVATAEKALEILERETDPSGLFVAHPLWVVGVGACHLEDYGRARPALERALSNRQTANASASDLAEVRFALGRTLFDGGIDHAKGLALVARARDDYRQAPRTAFVESDLAALDAWLTARR